MRGSLVAPADVHSSAMLRRLVERLRRRRPAPRPGPQGEEQEIAEAERRRRESGERFAARLQKLSGQLDTPYDPDPCAGGPVREDRDA